VQQRVLALIFGQPERSFYTSEIIRSVRLRHRPPVERELSRPPEQRASSASNASAIKSITEPTKALPFSRNCAASFVKTVGVAEPIRKSLRPYADAIKTAFVYGSVAKGTDTAQSDIRPHG